MTHTTIEGVRAPTFVPAWHTTSDGPAIGHSNERPPMLFPPTRIGEQAPEGAMLTRLATDAPRRIGKPFNEAPQGIRTAELKDLDPALQVKLIQQAAPLFQAAWADVDPRYREETGVVETLKARSASTHPLDRIFVKHLDGKLVATASLCPRDNPAFDDPYDAGKDPSMPLPAGRKYADGFLVDVYTVAEFESQGHATGLVRQVFDAATLHTGAQLHLYCEPALVPFYLKLGFGVVGNEIVDPSAPKDEQEVETIMRFPAPKLHAVAPFVPPKGQDGEFLPMNVDKPLPSLPQETGPEATARTT